MANAFHFLFFPPIFITCIRQNVWAPKKKRITTEKEKIPMFSFSIEYLLYSWKSIRVYPNAFQHIYCCIWIVRNALIAPEKYQHYSTATTSSHWNRKLLLYFFVILFVLPSMDGYLDGNQSAFQWAPYIVSEIESDVINAYNRYTK